MKRNLITDRTKPSKEQIDELNASKKMPIVYDEDCPPITQEMLANATRAKDWGKIFEARKVETQ